MPKRFRFNLQPVLDLRERREQEHQRRVAGLELERRAVEDRIREAQARIADARGDLRDRLAAHVGVSGVRLQAAATLHLTAQAQAAALQLAGVVRRLELARAELLRAATERKGVDLLKQRRHAAFLDDLKRREFAELDELAVMRHPTPARDPDMHSYDSPR